MPRSKLTKLISISSLIILALLIPLLLRIPYYLSVCILIVIYVLLATSLRFIMNAGLLSLGHSGFFAIGAYASAVLAKQLGMSFWLVLPTAGIATAIIAVLFGYVILRLKSMYLVLSTIAFAEIVLLLFSNVAVDIFGGTNGIRGISAPSVVIPGIVTLDFKGEATYYYLVLAVVFICLFIMYRLEKSRTGKIFGAIEQAESLALAIGINTMRWKVLAFAIGCFFAGIGGSLMAYASHAVAPQMFTLTVSMFLFAYIFIGGKDRFAGPIVGTIVIMIISESVTTLGTYDIIFTGLILIAAILFMPQGLMGLPQQLSQLISRFVKGKGGRETT